MKHMVVAAGVMAVVAATTACPDPCATQEERSAELGLLSGASTFEPLADGDTVVLTGSPQGGKGVFTAARTVGLESHLFLGILLKRVQVAVSVIDNTEGSADVLGEFQTSSSIQCVDGEFAIANDVVFGLDEARFGSGFDFEPTEELVAIDGHTVTLAAEFTDENSATITVSRDVVLDTVPDAVENP